MRHFNRYTLRIAEKPALRIGLIAESNAGLFIGHKAVAQRHAIQEDVVLIPAGIDWLGTQIDSHWPMYFFLGWAARCVSSASISATIAAAAARIRGSRAGASSRASQLRMRCFIGHSSRVW